MQKNPKRIHADESYYRSPKKKLLPGQRGEGAKGLARTKQRERNRAQEEGREVEDVLSLSVAGIVLFKGLEVVVRVVVGCLTFNEVSVLAFFKATKVFNTGSRLS